MFAKSMPLDARVIFFSLEASEVTSSGRRLTPNEVAQTGHQGPFKSTPDQNPKICHQVTSKLAPDQIAQIQRLAKIQIKSSKF